MDTSLDKFHAKMFELKLEITELFISKIAFAILSALEYMRTIRLMHRDIKPSNTLINATGEIKVCDFGISGNTIDSNCTTYIGTIVYMAVILAFLFIYIFFLIVF